jgi:hypothetical protein
VWRIAGTVELDFKTKGCLEKCGGILCPQKKCRVESYGRPLNSRWRRRYRRRRAAGGGNECPYGHDANGDGGAKIGGGIQSRVEWRDG